MNLNKLLYRIKFLLALSFMCITLLVSCTNETYSSEPLKTVLSSENEKIKRVMDSLKNHELQVIFTQIDRKQNEITFTDYQFQVNDSAYFYPASTVKFPTAVLALEKLNAIDTLNLDTRFYVEGDSVETTFRKAISEIFSVSDNQANNRLVEFLGQDAINKSLYSKRISNFRLSHRLGYHTEDLETKPLIIYLNDSTTTVLEGSTNTYPENLVLKGIEKGIGFYQNEELIEEAFDFSLKNYYPISSQHEVLKRVIFPENFKKEEQFNLSATQWAQLLKSMHTVPRNVGYDPETYYDGYCKFFMYGDTKKTIPDHIKIYNKVGFAYGTLTDCAYIIDTKNNVEFMLTATLLVNKDQIFNDDDYEYETIGIPFLAELGRQLYAFELGKSTQN